MPKKKKSRKLKKQPAVEHQLPGGFWPQVGGVVLAVLALLLIIASFGAGGPIMQWFLDAMKSLLGWAVYILPLVLIYVSVEIFRTEENRLPLIMQFATVMFVVWLAAFLQLFAEDTADMNSAQNGSGGGLIGWATDQGILALLNPTTAGIVLIVLILVTSLFVLRISPKSLLTGIVSIFRRDDSLDQANRDIAIKAAADDGVAELKLNEGVPTMQNMGKNSRSSLKDSINTDKTAEEQAALVAVSDPDWKFPGLDLLEKKQSPADAGDVKHNAQMIKDTLGEFGIDVAMEGANIGPKVTQYTLKPPAGVKLTRITALETNIALNLAAQAIRIEAPIPGQRAVGIEVPNVKPADVRLYGVLNDKNWQNSHDALTFAIGRDIAGEAIIGELNRMPHLLIAGQTGSGKSVMINTLLCSLLYRNSPSDMRLILVDPKQVEMTPYEDIPHLLTPVITEPEKCISALKWAVNEMQRRYSLLAEERVRDIKTYNQRKTDEAMPYIVIVIDELADLMMIAARDVEALIVRLAQKARAVGIHLVLATQRPSVDIITGLIKANIPARIAFTVASQVDSRTILDQIGAEKLLGQGDMLLLTPSMNKPKRIQGAFVSDEEVVKITDHLREQRAPQYDDEIIAQPVQLSGKGGIVMDFDSGDADPAYRDAVAVVVESGKASASLLQRRLRIGYAKAARLIDTMEEQGIVGPADGARPRDVLVTSIEDVFGSGED